MKHDHTDRDVLSDAASGNYELKQRLLDAIEKVCTGRQREAVRLYLEGLSFGEIAHAMNVGRSTVHRHIFGDERDGRGGGAIKKLRVALEKDFHELKELSVPINDKPSATEKVTAWFSKLPPVKQRDDMIVALAALLVIDIVADARRHVRRDDLRLYMPTSMQRSLGLLRATGYISDDGVTIHVLRTPLDFMAARGSA